MTRIVQLLAALALAGCEALPAAGPTVAEIEAVAAGPGQIREADYPFAVLDMTPAVAAALEDRPRRGFADAFAAGSGAAFRIAAGDVVNVTLWESLSAGLSGGLFLSGGGGQAAGAAPIALPPQTVPPSGRISVPFAGAIPVGGRAPEAVAEAIVARLEGKAINPQAIVTVDKTGSNAVSVVGDATPGGAVALAAGADRLRDAIARAGGVAESVREVTVTLDRDGRSATMPLSEVLSDPRHNIRLSPGDSIYLAHAPKTFVALGATGRSARLPFAAAAFTLGDALGEAGGILDQRADPDGVYVLRLEPSGFVAELGIEPESGPATPVAYHFEMRDLSGFFLARRFAMRDKDIVYAANAPTVAIRKVFDIFRGATGTVAGAQRAAP